MLFKMQTVNQQTRLAALELDGIYINPVCVNNLCVTEGKVLCIYLQCFITGIRIDFTVT